MAEVYVFETVLSIVLCPNVVVYVVSACLCISCDSARVCVCACVFCVFGCVSPYQLDKSFFLADSARLSLLCQVMNSPPDKENKNHL